MDRSNSKAQAYRLWAFVLICLSLVWLLMPKPEPEPEHQRVLEWPQFESNADAVRATRDRAIASAERLLVEILAQPIELVTFESTLVALDALEHGYARDWDRLALLLDVSPVPEVRDAAREAVVELGQWHVDNIELSEELYALIAAFADTQEATQLSGEDRLLLKDTLEDFRRAGLLTSPEERAEIASLGGRIAELSAEIGSNINDAEGIVEFRRSELAGLSDTQLDAFERNEDTGRYRVKTALEQQYKQVMKHAERRSTRRRALKARLSRATKANARLLVELFERRARLAELLGYRTWADSRVEPSMAGSVEVAQGFIVDLGERVDQRFRAEQVELRDLAREVLADPSFDVDDLRLEDVEYYANMLRERDYAVDEEVVNQYFAEPDVLRRIFDVFEQLFSLDIVVQQATHSWADDVQVAIVSDADSKQLLGVIYLDLHPRPGKFTHCATFDLVGGRQLSAHRYQAPLVAIVANFPVPIGDAPSLWSLDDVETMLHELGHALHGVLTRASHFAQSGLDVPWDFVEVPSQALERWIEDPTVLRRLAVHHETGEPMPEDLIARILATRKLGIGHKYKRLVALALVDFAVHGYGDPAQVPASADALYGSSNAIIAEHYYEPPPDTGMLASFGHLYGGYDGGYYSYSWSDAIVADLLSRFRESERGSADTELGAKLRHEIFEAGGSRPISESVYAFLGRDWSLDAFFEELAAVP